MTPLERRLDFAAVPTFVATRLALALLAVVLITSCREPVDLIIVNRSDTAIAWAPGIVVPACSQSVYTSRDIEAAAQKLDPLDMSWVPADAVLYQGPVPAQHVGATEPLRVVISGTAEPSFGEGPVRPEALPPCGGAPVGIDPVPVS